MRIRSIKPEFWRSDDIAQLDISARLTFIGLWSYVDDNGVGSDLLSLVADLYAADLARNPQETLDRVSCNLHELSDGGQIVRYEAPSGKAVRLHHQLGTPSGGEPPQQGTSVSAATCGISYPPQDTHALCMRPSETPLNPIDWSRGTGYGEQ